MHNVMLKRLCAAILLMTVALGAPLGARQQPPPQQQDEFIPIDQLPPQDQLPAAPLLVTAYSFVVLALFAYVLSVARRLGVVQRELDRLQSDARRGRT
jgi:CcmD family protein